MLMTILLVTLSQAAMPAVPRTAPTPQPFSNAANKCSRPEAEVAARFDRSRPLPARPLGELPPGETYLTVYREIGGCSVPLKIGRPVGR